MWESRIHSLDYITQVMTEEAAALEIQRRIPNIVQNRGDVLALVLLEDWEEKRKEFSEERCDRILRETAFLLWRSIEQWDLLARIGDGMRCV